MSDLATDRDIKFAMAQLLNEPVHSPNQEQRDPQKIHEAWLKQLEGMVNKPEFDLKLNADMTKTKVEQIETDDNEENQADQAALDQGYDDDRPKAPKYESLEQLKKRFNILDYYDNDAKKEEVPEEEDQLTATDLED